MSRRIVLTFATLTALERARRLDLEADIELAAGHTLAAERLAHEAQRLREAGA